MTYSNQDIKPKSRKTHRHLDRHRDTDRQTHTHRQQKFGEATVSQTYSIQDISLKVGKHTHTGRHTQRDR